MCTLAGVLCNPASSQPSPALRLSSPGFPATRPYKGGLTSSAPHSTMQRYSALLLLVLPALLAAQGLRDKIREKCGAVRPQSCTCQDGSTFTAFRPGNRPCGGFEQVELCTCPNGNTFTPDEVKNKAKEWGLKRSPCGSGVKPTSCSCADGSSISPG